MEIFIANINYEATEADLVKSLEAFGEVKHVKIIADKLSGKSCGYGFVKMLSDEDAKTVIEKLNGQEFMGRNLVVREVVPRSQYEFQRKMSS